MVGGRERGCGGRRGEGWWGGKREGVREEGRGVGVGEERGCGGRERVWGRRGEGEC